MILFYDDKLDKFYVLVKIIVDGKEIDSLQNTSIGMMLINKEGYIPRLILY